MGDLSSCFENKVINSSLQLTADKKRSCVSFMILVEENNLKKLECVLS